MCFIMYNKCEMFVCDDMFDDNVFVIFLVKKIIWNSVLFIYIVILGVVVSGCLNFFNVGKIVWIK